MAIVWLVDGVRLSCWRDSPAKLLCDVRARASERMDVFACALCGARLVEGEGVACSCSRGWSSVG